MDFAGDSNSGPADYELAVLHLQYSQLVSCATIAGLANSKFVDICLLSIHFILPKSLYLMGAQHFQ
jgi:hypothetical protein